MRQNCVSERYQNELLSKLYNLRKGNKNIMAYYDEFQKLILKLGYDEHEKHVIIRFYVSLNKEISLLMNYHKFATMEDVFQVALDIERNSKKEHPSSSKVTQQPILGEKQKRNSKIIRLEQE